MEQTVTCTPSPSLFPELEERQAAMRQRIAARSKPKASVKRKPKVRISRKVKSRTRNVRCKLRAKYKKLAGSCTGLSVTGNTGSLITYKATAVEGTGKFSISRGRILRGGAFAGTFTESVQMALTYTQQSLSVKLSGKDISVVVSVEAESIIDGPSAGLAVATALASAITGRPVRPFLAFTGEITANGDVLKIGSVVPKLLAARKYKLHEVILPATNRAEVEAGLTPYQLQDLTLHYVDSIAQALDLALVDVETMLSNDELRKSLVRSRKSKAQLRLNRRKAKAARSAAWAAKRAAVTARRAAIAERKTAREAKLKQDEQFRRELQIVKPKTKQQLSIEQRIAAAFAEGFQLGKR